MPASRTSISLPRLSTLTRSIRAVRKQRAVRCSSCRRNSWCLRTLVMRAQNPRSRQISTLLGWLSSRYANRITSIDGSHLPFLQVLTGGIPFPGVQDSAVGYHVLRGERPKKPEDAPDIGFSDLLWTFTQLCWHRAMESRPKVDEVVQHLRDAANSPVRLMPPCSPPRDIGLDSGEPVSEELVSEELMSESDEPSEFHTLIFLQCYLSSNGTDLFQSSGDTPESSIESQTTWDLLSHEDTESTQSTAPPQK